MQVHTRIGAAILILSAVLFGGLYYAVTLLKPMTAEEITGWRIVITVPCLTLFLIFSGGWRPAMRQIRRVAKHPLLILGLVATSGILGLQFWVFMWAPLHGRALEVSLGYFLLPLVMVLVGRLVYRERVQPLQWAAAAVAAIGVTHQVLVVGGFGWETLLVALGYPVYFSIRRRLRFDDLFGLWSDMFLLLPIAVVFVVNGTLTFAVLEQRPTLWWMLLLFGFTAGLAIVLYIHASNLLTFSLFGLLSYFEPVLMLAAALLLGERLTPGEWLTYGPIWLAVGILIVQGVVSVRSGQRRKRSDAMTALLATASSQ